VVAIYAVDCVVHAMRANDDSEPLALPKASPTFSHHVRPQTSSHTAASPCLALSHCRLCCLYISPFLPSYTASDDSHNTSIVSRRIALQPQPQAIHTVNGQITPDPYPVVLRLSRLASLLYGITNTP
jgi:hypothetical protein